MQEEELRQSVYRACNRHREEGKTIDPVTVEIAVQLRRIADSLEKIAETRTSVAVSLDRIADSFERAYPRRRQGD
jgi:hypothetical protein